MESPPDPKVPSDPILLSRARDMRHNSAPAEQRLWARLRNRQLNGYKFKRQVPLGSFVVDFYCFAVDLVVELDGESHLDHDKEDILRTEILQREGHRVIRFWNTDVFENFDGVLEVILSACENTQSHNAPSP